MDDFKEIMKQWLELETEIKNIQQHLKEKKTKFSKLSEYIITFMNSNEKKCCNLGSLGSVVVKTRKSSSLNRSSLQQFFMKYMNIDELQAIEAIDEMNKSKTIKETTYVKFVSNSDS
tara:strand:- start:255 stop:605 length:351 start_codon:yes stop_codon:yes gene_type:complete